MDSVRGPIRFENVTFSYPTRPAVTIFKNLDFEIPQGKNVAIVGPSGGGKSTIASILLRFYSPTEGRVLIDGKDISGMNAKSLRRKIGVVAQEPVLFSGTIAENIAYGRPDASRSEIIAAARQANCQFISDFVSQFPYLLLFSILIFAFSLMDLILTWVLVERNCPVAKNNVLPLHVL